MSYRSMEFELHNQTGHRVILTEPRFNCGRTERWKDSVLNNRDIALYKICSRTGALMGVDCSFQIDVPTLPALYVLHLKNPFSGSNVVTISASDKAKHRIDGSIRGNHAFFKIILTSKTEDDTAQAT